MRVNTRWISQYRQKAAVSGLLWILEDYRICNVAASESDPSESDK
jgi:hypothetical protein